jgi:hypothetical protein
VHIHAHNDYDATLFADSIIFIDKFKRPEGTPPEAAYKIMPEKETNKSSK